MITKQTSNNMSQTGQRDLCDDAAGSTLAAAGSGSVVNISFVMDYSVILAASAPRFSEISARSAFCGSANLARPSSIRTFSILAKSTLASISASTSAGGKWSTALVNVRPLAAMALFVAGGFV